MITFLSRTTDALKSIACFFQKEDDFKFKNVANHCLLKKSHQNEIKNRIFINSRYAKHQSFCNRNMEMVMMPGCRHPAIEM